MSFWNLKDIHLNRSYAFYGYQCRMDCEFRLLSSSAKQQLECNLMRFFVRFMLHLDETCFLKVSFCGFPITQLPQPHLLEICLM